jgi:hypothetical protein
MIGRIGFIVNGLIYLLISSMPFTMQVWRFLKLGILLFNLVPYFALRIVG